MIGVWWSGAEPDVTPAGDQSKGYKALMLQHGAGKFKVHEDLEKFVLAKGKSVAKDDYAQVLYNRGLLNSMLGTEAIRTAMKKYGNKPMTGEQVRWGFENLDLTAARIKELGFEGMVSPIKLTCQDHQGADVARVQQWDGKEWKVISGDYKADLSILDPMVKEHRPSTPPRRRSRRATAPRRAEAQRLRHTGGGLPPPVSFQPMRA